MPSAATDQTVPGSAPPRRALLLLNTRSGRAGSELQPALALLTRAGIDILRGDVDGPEDIDGQIRAHAGRVDRIILGGGDGTLNAAASALIATGLPLGVLPLGTANDFARTLQLPLEPAAACQVIADDNRIAVDIGRVNGSHYFNVAHIGLGAVVTRALSGPMKQRWGVLSYARLAIATFERHRPFRAEVRCDERVVLRLRTLQIAVGNGRHYGGGMTVAEDAALDDQRLHLYSIEPVRWWRLLGAMLAFRSGRLRERRNIAVLSGRRFDISTRRPQPISADGEPVGHTPARFDLLAGAVTVFAPRHYRSQSENRPAGVADPPG